MTDVVIYGTHSDDWIAALGPTAEVWHRLPFQVSVFHAVDSDKAIEILNNLPSNACVIPLLEVHALSMPHRGQSLSPEVKVIEILSDKGKFARWMKRSGYRKYIPKTAEGKPLRLYPQLVKKKRMNAGQGQIVVSNKAEMKHLVVQSEWISREWISQQAIPSKQEYVWHVLCNNGEVLWSVLMKYTLPGDISIRTSAQAAPTIATLPSASLEPLFKVMKKLNYTGPANIDFKLLNGKPILFEINPRLGGSLLRPEFIDHLAEALIVIVSSSQ